MMEQTAYEAIKASGINIWTDLPDKTQKYPISVISLDNSQSFQMFFQRDSLGVTTYAAKKSEALLEANRIKEVIEGLYLRPEVTEAVMTDLAYSYINEPKQHAYMATYDVTVKK